MGIRLGHCALSMLMSASLPLVTVAAARAGDCEPAWTPDLFFPGLPGMDDGVHDMIVFDDGLGGGPALYAAGNFMSAAGVPANRVAKWNGASWSALGDGLNNPVLALAVFDDGSGGGPALYAGGIFTTAGGGPASCVAKWDGASWSALGTGMSAEGTGLDPYVSALAVFDDGSGNGPALYAAGFFLTAGDASANSIAKWDGESWSGLGTGLNSYVNALEVFDDGSASGPALYAGGIFTTAGGVTANRIAKWDGTSWSALGAGVSVGSFPFPGVFALKAFDDGSGPALFVGGGFGRAGSVSVSNIARWTGSSWTAVSTGMLGGAVFSLNAFDDGAGNRPALYAGGDFFGAGGVPANRVARWDGSTWSGLGTGLTGSGDIRSVRAMTGFENDTETAALYVGGFFDHAGGMPSLNIARWAGCPSVQTPCPGDANGDGLVNFTDLNAVLADFGLGGVDLPGDVNADGQVDFADLNLVLSNFGLPCPD